MIFTIKEMTMDTAQAISTWQYDGEYSIYSMVGDQETIDELTDGSYYSVYNQENEVVGFFCFGSTAQVPGGRKVYAYIDEDAIDIGLGVRPDLTGCGLGVGFLEQGLKFAYSKFAKNKIRLTVATFNQRAIRVYERVGFTKQRVFFSKTSKGDIEFISMMLEL